MSHALQKDGVEISDRTERAQLAVKNFRSLQYGLTAYARALTGKKDVRVEIATGAPRTDGKIIHYQPPIALGDKTPHVRRDCDKRNPVTKKQVCPACAIREEVMVNILHEIGHIAFGSFELANDADKRKALELAVEEWGGKYAERIKQKFDNAAWYEKANYLSLANLVSPFMPYLVNCLEDARVDSAMFRARKGVRPMMQASSLQIFTEGIERPGGERQTWAEAPANSQVSVACYLSAAGIEGWQDWMHAEVVAAVEDDTVQQYLTQVAVAPDAAASYNLAFPVLARLRELGFFQMPEDKEKDEAPEEDDQEAGDPGEAGEPEDGEAGSEGGPGEGTGEGEAPESDDNEGDAGQGGGEHEAAEAEGEPDTDESAGAGAGSAEDEEVDGADQDAVPGEPDEGGSGSADSSSGDDDGQEGGGNGEAPEESDGDSDEAEEIRGSGSVQEDSDGDESDDAGSGGSSAGDAPEAGDAGAESDGGEAESEGDEGSDPGEADVPGEPADGGHEDDGDDEGPADDGAPGPDQSEGRVDTGAYDDEGAIDATNSDPMPDGGTPDQVAEDIRQLHEVEVHAAENESDEDDHEVQVAIVQSMYFEQPSAKVTMVNVHRFNQPLLPGGFANAWEHRQLEVYGNDWRTLTGVDVDLDVPEQVMGPALLQTRRVFTDNARGSAQRNLKSGQINRKALGGRAWRDDERLFHKKRLPGRRSYAVLLGIDVSGSTVGENLALAKRAAWAQAELCARAGVDFALYAHSGHRFSQPGERIARRDQEMSLDIYEIKGFNDPWDTKHQEGLRELGSDSDNLDGHTIEFYRKRLEEQRATDKVLLYYTDGKMPAANHDEELEILQREVRHCKRTGIHLMGVGIRTDSPKQHGLDTVQVDTDEDLKAVVMHLEKRLAAPRQ